MRRFLLILLALPLISCGQRDYIKPPDAGVIGFKFFFFANLNGESLNASGDAALTPGREFKFRVYDNMVGQHVFDFRSDANGDNMLFYPADKLAVIKVDKKLSDILTTGLPLFFAAGRQELTNSYDYGSAVFTITAEKRDDLGRTRTLRIAQGDQWIVFDITEYTGMDFPLDLEGFRFYREESQKSFFEWLGEAYGRN